MRRRLPLIGAEQQAVALLAQIVRDVGVAQQRQLLLARAQLRDHLGHQVLVRHRDDRHVLPDHRHDLARAIAGGIDHDLAAHVALVGLHQPFLAGALQRGDAREALDAAAEVLRALGIGLHQLAGVDVAVIRIVQRAHHVVQLDERILVLDLVGRDHLELDALRARHRRDVAVLVHALLVVGEADRAGDVIVDRIADLVAQLRIELGGMALRLDDVPRGGEVRDIAGRVPGRAGGQLVHLQQQAVGPAHLGQMIERAAPDSPAPDDDHARVIGHECLPVFLFS